MKKDTKKEPASCLDVFELYNDKVIKREKKKEYLKTMKWKKKRQF